MLKTRVLSALILAPIILADIYLGGYWLHALLLLAGALMGWEWARLCGHGRVVAGGYLVILILGALPLWFTLEIPWPSIWAVLAGTALVLLANLLISRIQALWLAGGTLYIGLALVSFLWLRELPGQGLTLILWVLIAVWAVDIGAYFAGRRIGGPKLAPAISPNKTWAGLIGGALAAAVVSGVATVWLTQPLLIMIPAGIVLAVVAQSGDLLESWCKRHFGVKDSSHVIPGHGGILDRVDGLLAVLPLVSVFIWALEVRI